MCGMSARKMTARRLAAGTGVAAVATVAAVMSYEHQRVLASTHGQPDLLAALWPIAVDGLILACGVQLATDRAGGHAPRLWSVIGFWLGVVVSVAANALATPGGVVDRSISAFPAVALLITVEALTTRPKASKASEFRSPVHVDADTKPAPLEEIPVLPIAPLPPPVLAVVPAAQPRTDGQLAPLAVRQSKPRTDDELLAVLADVPRDADGTVPVRRAASALGCGPDRARRLLGTAGLLRTAIA
jgi:hypothetical protein